MISIAPKYCFNPFGIQSTGLLQYSGASLIHGSQVYISSQQMIIIGFLVVSLTFYCLRAPTNFKWDLRQRYFEAGSSVDCFSLITCNLTFEQTFAVLTFLLERVHIFPHSCRYILPDP